jgi:hypothetical protein
MSLASTATTNAIAIGGFIATLVGLVSSLWFLLKQLKAQEEATRQQTRALLLQIITPYAEKYERILEGLSPGERLRGFWGLPASSTEDERTMRTFLQYCNLCSEEYYLAHSKETLIEADLWTVWEAEMKKVFASEFGRAAWRNLRANGLYDSHSKFREQVDSWTGSSGRLTT